MLEDIVWKDGTTWLKVKKMGRANLAPGKASGNSRSEGVCVSASNSALQHR